MEQKNYFSTLFFLLSTFCLNAQFTGFYNNGLQVIVKGSVDMIVKNGAFENANGSHLKNSGNLVVEGNFKNDNSSVADGDTSANGHYRVLGDWINNGTFTADQSTVHLYDTTPAPAFGQNIDGSSVTRFYNLSLENSNTIKRMKLSSEVMNLLTMENNELYTGDYNMLVSNNATAAITGTGVGSGAAFISSTNGGRLSRVTNSTNTYLFPTGWRNSNGNVDYRPIEVAPSTTDNLSFNIRFAETNTTTGNGYNVNSKAPLLAAVNDKFYHLISQNANTAIPADLTVYYNTANDGSWATLARWENKVQWEDLIASAGPSANGLASVKKTSWIDNKAEPHALANTKTVQNFYNFPNAFAPNSGNENSTFGIINQFKLVQLEDLKIFNRWGEMVFDKQRDGRDDWNGIYQGKLQPMGNYTFMAKVKKISGEELPLVTGNIALIW